MRHSFTATTTAQSISANLFAGGLLPQSIRIYNSGANPVFYTSNEVATATDCVTIPAGTSESTILTQPIDYLSFITTGGDSKIIIQTL